LPRFEIIPAFLHPSRNQGKLKDLMNFDLQKIMKDPEWNLSFNAELNEKSKLDMMLAMLILTELNSFTSRIYRFTNYKRTKHSTTTRDGA
jgi:hypothetical protein